MNIEETEDAELNYNDPLKNGIVIFPESIEDINKIEKLKEFLNSL